MKPPATSRRERIALLAWGAIGITISVVALGALAVLILAPRPTAPSVSYQNPPNVAQPINGTWSQIAVTDHLVYVAGQRGRYQDGSEPPITDGGRLRIEVAFRNFKMLAQAGGSSLPHTLRIVVYASDIKYRAIVNAVEAEPEFWGNGPKPPRTFVISGLAEGDIFEVQGELLK